MSIYVSIGRNLGAVAGPAQGTPLSTDDWQTFRDLTRLALARHAGPILSTADGLGFWEGRSEDTYILVGAGDTVTHELAEALRVLAYRYRQDAIAVTVGAPTFVEPAWPAASASASFPVVAP